MNAFDLAAKANLSRLWGDTQLADVTIQIKPKAPAADAAAPGGQEQQQQQQEPKEDPPAKRARTAEAEAQAADAAAAMASSAADVIATMRVHEVALVHCSDYFRVIFTGAGASMVEGRTRVITVELEDEQEVEDFQRLIKLSYHTTYAEEDGQELSKAQLLRLLYMADAYEMARCVAECSASLQQFKGYDEAVAFFNSLQDECMEDPRLGPAIEAAGDVIAEALGPVEKLWDYASDPVGLYVDWERQVWLEERVTALPATAMQATLGSSKLKLKSENEAFSLALWWMLEQEGSEEERQRQFNQLLKCLRYAHMSGPFLAWIAQIDWVQRSGLLPAIMTRAIWRRGLSSWIGEHPRSRVTREGHDTSYRRSVLACFGNFEIESMEEERNRIHLPVGMVQGFPCFLSVIREKNGKFSVALSTSFRFDKEDALAPRMTGKQDAVFGGYSEDMKRCGFAFRALGGQFGSQDAKRFLAKSTDYLYWSRAAYYHPMKVSASDFEREYDDQGIMYIQLDLEIETRI